MAEIPIDLSFITSLPNLTDQERSVLKIAQSNGDTILEESDLETKKVRTFIKKLGLSTFESSSDRFTAVKNKLIDSLFARAMPNVEEQSRNELSSRMMAVMDSSDLSQVFQSAQKLNSFYGTDIYTALTPENQQATLYILMVLENSIHFNNGLTDNKISPTFSDDMAQVEDAIVVGKIKIKKEEVYSGTNAFFLPDATGETIGTMAIDEDDEDQYTIVHEATHAKQAMSSNHGDKISDEEEAYLVEANYQGLKLGFDVALERYSDSNDIKARKNIIGFYEAGIQNATGHLDSPSGRATWLYSYLLKEMEKMIPSRDNQYEALTLAKLIHENADVTAIDAQRKILKETIDKREKVGLAQEELGLIVDRCFPDSFKSSYISAKIIYGDGTEEKVETEKLNLDEIFKKIVSDQALLKNADSSKDYSIPLLFLQGFQTAIENSDINAAKGIVDQALALISVSE